MLLSHARAPRRFVVLLLSIFVMQLLSGTVSAQKLDKKKHDIAVRRSANAARVLKTVAALPPAETIPRELIERARAVAVFPSLDKINLIFEKVVQGYGLICRRMPDGWSVPAYYSIGILEIRLTSLKVEKPDVIVLFMNDKSLEKFEKGAVLFKDEVTGVAGPVGELTLGKENDIRAASVLAYMMVGGKLQGIKLENDSFAGSGVNPDNNINKALYGLKGREVLAGKSPLWPSVLPSVAEFQNTLASLSKQQ